MPPSKVIRGGQELRKSSWQALTVRYRRTGAGFRAAGIQAGILDHVCARDSHHRLIKIPVTAVNGVDKIAPWLPVVFCDSVAVFGSEHFYLHANVASSRATLDSRAYVLGYWWASLS
jgi:hypothetical protein